MGIFGDGIKSIVGKIDKMREEYMTMSANFKNLEIAFDKFEKRSEASTEKLLKENEDLRRRVTEIEGIINATLKTSMKEAIQSAVREHLEKKGTLNDFTKETLDKLLGPPASDDGKLVEDVKK